MNMVIAVVPDKVRKSLPTVPQNRVICARHVGVAAGTTGGLQIEIGERETNWKDWLKREKWLPLLIVLEVHWGSPVLVSITWFQRNSVGNLCCCSSPFTFSPALLHLLPLARCEHFLSLTSQWRCVSFTTYCLKSYLISFRRVPPHVPKPLTAAADYPPHTQIHAGSLPRTFSIHNVCHPWCCAQRRERISRKRVSGGSSVFLALSHVRVLFHVAAPEFQAERCRCGGAGRREKRYPSVHFGYDFPVPLEQFHWLAPLRGSGHKSFVLLLACRSHKWPLYKNR